MIRRRYRFGDYTLSPARRLLLKAGREVPLIPRYFDLLVTLVEERDRVVDRREIFDVVWADVVVSDGALTQAVRSLRRALGDRARNASYIRTAARHGYQFVFHPVHLEDDEGPLPASRMLSVPEGLAGDAVPQAAEPTPEPGAAPAEPPQALDEALRSLLEDPDEDRRREAAETLHELGTELALPRLDRRPGHAAARALLRDTRWDVPGAGHVPILGAPGWAMAALHLMRLRARHACRLAGARWGGAAVGGMLAGIAAGIAEGLVLLLLDRSRPPNQPIIYATLGAIIGGVGAAGVGAGLAAVEALFRSARRPVLVAGGAAAGGLTGWVAHLIGRWTLEEMFGTSLAGVGGGLEGLILGGAAGLGYAWLTPTREGGGMAAPRGTVRFLAAAGTGLCCAAAGVAITLIGGRMAGASLDLLIAGVDGSRLGLEPLARLLGEATYPVQSIFEGLLFGLGLITGLTRRPKER